MSRFVADFIGETNFIEGTITDVGRVSIADGAVVYARTDAPSGTEVTLTLRPEKISIHARDAAEIDAQRNRLPGEITRRLYYGESIYYEIELAGGTLVDARHENIPSLHRWDVGDAVTISFHRESAEALVS